MKSLARLAVMALTMGSFAGLVGAADTKGDVGRKSEPGKTVTMPKPPQELADVMKHVAGKWKCTGKAWMPDGREFEMSGTLTSAIHFDGFWEHDSWDGKMGSYPYKFDAYTTYDSTAKKWRRVVISSLGGQLVGSSTGIEDKQITFEMQATGPMGAMLLKEHMDGSNMSTGARFWTERTLDQGKTWQKDFDLVCKK